jgi:hypothetical protein
MLRRDTQQNFGDVWIAPAVQITSAQIDPKSA